MIFNLSAIAPLAATTEIVADWGILSDYADDGTLRQRYLSAAQHFIVDARWELLPTAVRDALISTLERHATDAFELDIRGYRYRVMMLRPPTEMLSAGATRHAVAAQFRGTRAPLADPIGAIIAAYDQPSCWYDPSDLATMWQDAAGTIPAAVGLPVGRIDDKGTLGLAAMQATAADRPTLMRDSGGRLYLQFDGDGQTLTIATGMPAPTAGCCATVAWRHAGYPAANPILYYQRGLAADGSQQHPLLRLADIDAVQSLLGGQSIDSVPGSIAAGAAAVATTHLATDNAARKSYLDGVLFGSASAPALSDAADNPAGALGGPTFAGRIYGLIHIQHGIAAADRVALERELMRRAGIL